MTQKSSEAPTTPTKTSDWQVLDQPVKRNNSPIKYIIDSQKFRTRIDLLKLRFAIDSAENSVNPNRELLHNIYREVIKDPDLSSQWDSRKMKTKQKTFKVVSIATNEENKDLTEVLEADWFYTFIDAVLDSKQWGFTLIEFGDMTPDGNFVPYQVSNYLGQIKIYDPVTVIDRDNVKPEFGIITDFPSSLKGISMTDPEYSKHLLFIGGHVRNYGWLEKAAKYILFKDNCLGNWSEWAEVFGMDKRIAYTATQGPDRENFLRSVRDLGSNSYGVFGERDKIEFVGTSRTDAYKVYEQLIARVDASIAKLIFGQDVVSNNTGRVIGQTGENIANMYGDSDSKFVQVIVNKRLFPLMENLGFSWKGYRFMWDNTEHLSLSDRVIVDKTVYDMGFKHSPDYINSTYGVNVTA